MLSKSRVERSLRRRLRARKNRRKIALRLSTSGLAPEASPRGDVSGGHGVASRLYHWVQGSPLPKEVRNPRRVPHQIKFFASRLSLPRDSLSAAPSHNPRMDRHARELPAESLRLRACDEIEAFLRMPRDSIKQRAHQPRRCQAHVLGGVIA